MKVTFLEGCGRETHYIDLTVGTQLHFSFGTFNSFLTGLARNQVCNACCSAQMDTISVKITSAKQSTCTNCLLSKYIHCVMKVDQGLPSLCRPSFWVPELRFVSFSWLFLLWVKALDVRYTLIKTYIVGYNSKETLRVKKDYIATFWFN